MKNKTCPSNHVTSPFVAKHAEDVMGVVSGWDRLRLRGTLRALYQPTVLLRYLVVCQVLLKGFEVYSKSLTRRILGQAEQLAKKLGRPWLYIGSTKSSKEEMARSLAQDQQVGKGLIAVLRCVEPCKTYEMRAGMPVLKDSKCMHLYFYYQHPVFGFMHLRLQTWFPFQIELCLNGREWLAQQLNRAKSPYQRQDNYFAWIKDLPKAQELMERQLQTQWLAHLQRLLEQSHPLHKEICRPLDWQYYWTCCESEYATDVMFQQPASLGALYPRLVQHALLSYSSADVLRFLGRNVPLRGNANYQGQVLTDLKVRPEGVRIKHRVGRNTLKMYDKFGRGLRVETTINECEDFQVFRSPEGHPDQPKKWRSLRRALADLPRRAQISKAANERYLLALAAVDDKTPLHQLATKLCGPCRRQGTRYRALNPWSAQDGALLQAINRGEFAIHGLRNKDLQPLLFPKPAGTKERRRRAARISRLLRLLRAHRILRKIPSSHRYQLTARGRTIVTALLSARQADTQQLTQMAA